MTRDDLVAFVRRNNSNLRERREPRNGGGNGAGAGARALRKCSNCGLVHRELKCFHTAVDFKDRPCFPCGKENHLAKDCKEKLSGANDEMRIGSLHAGAPLRSLSASNDVFSTLKKTIRPMPQKATLDEFLSTANRISSLSQRERKMAPPRSSARGVQGAVAVRADEASPAETPVGTSDEIKANQ